jgi:hypothetical protein
VRFPHPPPIIVTRSAFLYTFFRVQEVFRIFFPLQNLSFFSVSDSVAVLGDSCELVCGVAGKVGCVLSVCEPVGPVLCGLLRVNLLERKNSLPDWRSADLRGVWILRFGS